MTKNKFFLSFGQQGTRVQIWLYENKDTRIEGKLVGFDEYMNVVLDDAEEIQIKKKMRKNIGKNNQKNKEQIKNYDFLLKIITIKIRPNSFERG